MKKKLWKKVTPIPIEMNGHGYLWDCTRCGFCLTYWGKDPNGKVTCPKCERREHEI